VDVLGLIPARGGSKSIPHKNIASLAGRPLLAYTCDAALDSQRLTRVVVSTDDPAIADVARACGVEVPFMRPAELARDDTLALDYIRHALNTLEEEEGYRPQVIVLLQPTSPLRRAEHIDGGVDLLLETGADSVVSVVEVAHQFNPVSVMRIEGGKLVPFLAGPLISRRQEKPLVYARNGPAVLVMRREVILQKGSIYGDDCRPLVMDAESSLDVDTPLDLELAAFFLARRGGGPGPGPVHENRGSAAT
jgi:CMP-N-acetylneuraminic acid synthetase